MAKVLTPAEIRLRLQRDVKRSLQRAHNGITLVAGANPAEVGQSPKDVVWSRDKVELWRYRSDMRTYRPPVFIVMSLVSRSYVLDLHPGNSFVEALRDAGFDTFVLDWGVPDEAEAEHRLETYVDEYLPRAMHAAREVAGADDLTVLGYCMGGIFVLMLAALHPDLPIRNLMLMATAIDFDKVGLMSAVMGEGRLDPEDVIDHTGNVPAEVLREGFRLIRPTAQISQYATLWQNMWNDEYMEGYKVFAQWARDHIPFPGGVAKQCTELFSRRNAFMDNTLELGGRHVDLGAIECPVLNILAEKDHIVPVDAARPISRLVGSGQVDELALSSGHVGLVAGQHAHKHTIPAILDWLRSHSDPIADPVAGEGGRR